MPAMTENTVLVLSHEFGSIDALISTLVLEARTYSCVIEGRFNGITLRADPKSTYMGLSRTYWAQRVALAESEG